MKPTQFDRKTVSYFLSELNKDLADLSRKYGIRLALGNTKFTNTDFTTKLTAVIDSPATAAMSPSELRWAEAARQHARFFGFHPDAVGKEFLYNGEQATFVGINTKARSYPYIFRLPGNRLVKSAEFSSGVRAVKGYKP